MKSSAELAVVCADEDSVLALPVTNADELYWQSTRVLPDYKKMECGNGLRVRSWLLLPDSLVLLFMPVFVGV